MNRTAAPLDTEATADLAERRLQVVAEQAEGLRWQIALTALVVAAIVWRDVPTPAVLAWLCAVLVSREWRMVALRRLSLDRARPVAHRLRAVLYWNLLIGLCNGSAALFMLWLDPTLDAVLTMILVSWGAGAVSTSSTVMPAFIAYAGLLFAPTALMWIASGSWLGLGVGALVLMFFGVQLRFARRNLQLFEESFGIRAEREALARSLEYERGQLALARDEAVRANHDKSRFLAGASHDLRQPLQAMALNVSALRHAALAPEVRSVIDVVDVSLEQLRSMLDALLDVSKLDAGVVLPQPRQLQLDRLLDALQLSFGAVAQARGVALRSHCPPRLTAHTDADLLRRLLANLIDNALKFTPCGGHVDIEATLQGDTVCLQVRDTGPGIAPEHHAVIFEDLVQLPAVAGSVRAAGHGLGLGIVRRLAALLGLKVELDSQPGVGAVFSLQLPRDSALEPEAAPATPRWSLRDRCVLVLDDDAMVRGAYMNALGALGCRALGASDLAEAMELLKREAPHAAVVDWRLEGQANGFDAIERLRAQQPALPVVMVTADTGAALQQAAQAAGVPLLCKPTDEQTLGQALATAIEQQGN
jgi:signal transduction histidine kinase/CheY-like chemotaxis protein